MIDTPRLPSNIESKQRPKIMIKNGVIYHNDELCLVVLKKDVIKIGCSDITPDAAFLIVERWKKEFTVEDREVII